jgi:uncharacterized protein
MRHKTYLLIVLSAIAGLSCSPATEPEGVQAIETSATPSEEPAAVPEHVPEAADKPTHTNKLIGETSPYLLQHAHNPVNWYPWGPEALQRAKDENKPIFLSIGYSSCHWCHVMERESFENDDVAAILNEHFISIKVDREERPDLDEIYMAAVQAMTGSGGWPMSVFLTPDQKPFFGGTYFPRENKYGRIGFIPLLKNIAEAWDQKHDEVVKSSEELTKHIHEILTSTAGSTAAPTPSLIQDAVQKLAQSYDSVDGGFGGAPKFPSSPSIALLLREYRRTGDEQVLTMATHTLDKMAQGGMYDHLGGGFARYSTDQEWLVPHFEKMLYDNAQLAQAYLEAYQATGNPFYKDVVDETFTYILRDMTDSSGGFYSAEDADSEGEEGKFYVWSRDEIVRILGEDDAQIFNTYYNVKENGNFDSPEPYHAGLNILHTPISDEQVAKILDMDTAELQKKLVPMKAAMLAIRSERVRPGLDDKVLTSWNALMISAFAQGYQVLGDPTYRDAAVKAADFILTDMMRDGELLRTYRNGESHLAAYLDDYACMITALLDVYEATFDVRWLEAADALAATMNEKFWDETTGIYYFTSEDHQNVLVRTRPTQDGATPSGNSMAAYGLLRLAKMLDREPYYNQARRILEANQAYMTQYSGGFLKMLVAVDFYLYPPKEIALVGPETDAGTQALLEAVRREFIPNKVVALLDPTSDDADTVEKAIPLLLGKVEIDGKPSAYVCKNFACKLPVTDPDSLRALLYQDENEGV